VESVDVACAAKTLDQLFRKTKTRPWIYWLPKEKTNEMAVDASGSSAAAGAPPASSGDVPPPPPPPPPADSDVQKSEHDPTLDVDYERN
jgi:hypothetical protein